ncbi:Light-regulated protein [Citrus sinensis]|uniref:Light-regulated protein n=1 Tax=Citrus sinensis TaxID=2711 RepID=A0ACB8IPQ7_CITSI|nr:Light-regulated protein [Citrus sinensis]
MQTTLSFSPSMFSILAPTKAFVFPGRSMPRLHVHTRCLSIETATVACDASTFDYSSMTSVFPAEACETIGGEACNVEMYPEVKLQAGVKCNKATIAAELMDREYMEYDMFLAEACDDLGGEFCEAEYQTGVY